MGGLGGLAAGTEEDQGKHGAAPALPCSAALLSDSGCDASRLPGTGSQPATVALVRKRRLHRPKPTERTSKARCVPFYSSMS